VMSTGGHHRHNAANIGLNEMAREAKSVKFLFLILV